MYDYYIRHSNTTVNGDKLVYVSIYNQTNNKCINYVTTERFGVGGLHSITEGRPDKKYLVRTDVLSIYDLEIHSYDGVRINHNECDWDDDFGGYIDPPNDDRFYFDNEYGCVRYREYRPRFHVYTYRGDYYIWCCDNMSIVRVSCKDHKLIIEESFPALTKFHPQLTGKYDWTYHTGFNTWIECFRHHRIGFRTEKQAFDGMEIDVINHAT